MSSVQGLATAYPGFETLLKALSGYFPVPRAVLDQNLEEALGEKPYQHWCTCCLDLVDAGVFPDLAVTTDEQVARMWTNDLFTTILERGASFKPPPTINLAEHLWPPLEHDGQVEGRVRTLLAREATVYWKRAFGLVFPELFLEPFLRPAKRILVGLDLACGWGRATFNLRRWDRYRVHAVDLSESGLAELAHQRNLLGLEDKIETTLADIQKLAFPDSSIDFVLAFDIFEHLTDPLLDRVLMEILRVCRFGAVLYCEVPMNDYFPPITHLQSFTPSSFEARLKSLESASKTFEPAHHNIHFPSQRSFMVLHTMFARRRSG